MIDRISRLKDELSTVLKERNDLAMRAERLSAEVKHLRGVAEELGEANRRLAGRPSELQLLEDVARLTAEVERLEKRVEELESQTGELYGLEEQVTP